LRGVLINIRQKQFTLVPCFVNGTTTMPSFVFKPFMLIALLAASLGAPIAWSNTDHASTPSGEYVLERIGAGKSTPHLYWVSLKSHDLNTLSKVFEFESRQKVVQFFVIDSGDSRIFYVQLEKGETWLGDLVTGAFAPAFGLAQTRFIARGPNSSVLMALSTSASALTVRTIDGQRFVVDIPGYSVLGASWDPASNLISIITNSKKNYSEFEVRQVDAATVLSSPNGIVAPQPVGLFSGYSMLAANQSRPANVTGPPTGSYRVDFAEALSDGEYTVGLVRGLTAMGYQYRLGWISRNGDQGSVDLPKGANLLSAQSVRILDVDSRDPGSLHVWMQVEEHLVEVKFGVDPGIPSSPEYLTVLPKVFSNSSVLESDLKQTGSELR
jgi:hypothetical protein